MTKRHALQWKALLFGLAVVATPALAQSAPDFAGTAAPADAIWLDSLSVNKVTQGWGAPNAGKSVDGNPLKLKDVTYTHGIGTHADSLFNIDLKGAATRFVSKVGVDDEKTGAGSVRFEVWVDGKRKQQSGILHGGDAPEEISIDLTGAKQLLLMVSDGGDGIDSDHADWAGAVLYLAPGAKEKPAAGYIDKDVTIPIARIVPAAAPAIHGPRIVGATPGRAFLFCIPATGQGPLEYSARNLPKGLTLDPKTGIISGSLAKAGETIVQLTVKGPKGIATRKLKIVGGENRLALTPPMGWNSWNVWAGAINDQKVRDAVDAMVNSGLASHGFQYVNIDDCWQGSRGDNGELAPNAKFPDMKALADYAHSKGLKLGIYSSPGPRTCAGYEGSYQREQQDADTYAKWGIDYLKYDWCSYGSVPHEEGLPGLKKPYQVMREALDKCGRDIIYSLCQYGMGNVWTWGTEVGGNCWRTTGDINDSWGSLSSITFSQDGHEKGAGPGHWNDPDMLVVGKVGWGPNLRRSRLTPNEQILHITMWSLLSSPLLIGCDMTQIDAFTLDLLTNDEVLDINQDPLGKPAGRKAKDDFTEVWARPLWDGTTAVGLVNRAPFRAKVTAKWSDLGIKGSQPVRDLWQRRDLGQFEGAYSVEIPAHGAILVKIGKPNRTDW